ncbi:MAG: phosphoribosylamine--glycine ligase [Bryobacteraceae bacterium]|nr:phosphoribosylamine--glycine ligase [Bryobacteraceae bacterium]
MKVLVIGGGGREHALAWRLSRCPSVSQVLATPGNPGIAAVADCLPCEGSPAAYRRLATSGGVGLTVVGPEAPLVAGVVDEFRAAGLPILGPTASAAQLEGSKIFAKDFMRRHSIPTAAYTTADNLAEGKHALGNFHFPVVLKADGLAAGKGVLICQTRQEAEAALDGLFSGALVGAAGSRVVIEEFLTGEEVSFIVLTDGTNILPLPPTQDHKAVYDGDQGPNTGGMGAYCDARILSDTQVKQVLREVIQPTIEGMRSEGAPFTGFLYAGLMMTATGPKVLEFNVRLGDPETQALMYSVRGDFAAALLAAAEGRLSHNASEWATEPSTCVVMAAAGYPGQPRTGDLITGIPEAEATGATVFHAGTNRTQAGLETAGGRVLGVTASGADLPTAIRNAYAAVAKIQFPGAHIRTDIGRKGLRRWQHGTVQ